MNKYKKMVAQLQEDKAKERLQREKCRRCWLKNRMASVDNCLVPRCVYDENWPNEPYPLHKI